MAATGLDGLIKNLSDIMRQDPGISANITRVEEMSWMFFLNHVAGGSAGPSPLPSTGWPDAFTASPLALNPPCLGVSVNPCG